jgi:serine/threonine-protein kinase RsbW
MKFWPTAGRSSDVVENALLNILNLQPELHGEFFAAAKLPDDVTVREFDTVAKLLRQLKQSREGRGSIVVILPKRAYDPRKVRRIRLASLDSPLYIVARTCSEKDYLAYLTIGARAVLQPPFDRGDVQHVLNGRENGAIPFPRSAEVVREGQARLDFLMPSMLTRILGVNRLVAFLADEFGFPAEDSRVNLPLVMDEALTNAILHGNKQREDRKVHVRIYISVHRFFVQVEDEGEGFDPALAGDPKAGENVYRRSGRGIYLMREIMDRVEFKNGGRLVELEKRNPLNGGA